MKQAKILCMAAAAAVFFTGCSRFEPDSTAMLAKKDGSVTAVVIETLDQSYYDSAELESLINQEVADYNASAGAENIRVENFTAENQTANLTMEYAGGDDYAAFNNVTFFTGDILGAYDAGYDFQTVFQSVERGNVTNSQVTREEVLNSRNYYTVIMEEPMELQVDGNIVYASSNVEITGRNTCRVLSAAGTQEETEVSEEESAQPETLEDGTVLLTPTKVTRAEDTAESSLAYIMYE